ncbi:hypothetical protein I541_5745 [Mycobacteroides abscessus]|nr:hypothetical protein I541_5745 [Mycobacteroides abscessus]
MTTPQHGRHERAEGEGVDPLIDLSRDPNPALPTTAKDDE